MPKDKKMTHTYTTRSKSKKKQAEYNNHESSSDDGEWDDVDTDDGTDDDEFDPNEYQKLLLQLFPSEFTKKKVDKTCSKIKTNVKETPKKGSNNDRNKPSQESEDEESEEEESEEEESEEEESEEEESEEEESEEENTKKTSKQSSNKKKTKRKKGKSRKVNTEDENSSDSDDESSTNKLLPSDNSNVNIIFTIGDVHGMNEYSDSEYDTDTDDDTDADDDTDTDDDDDEPDKYEENGCNADIKNAKEDKSDASQPSIVPMSTTCSDADNEQQIGLCDSEIFDKFNKMVAELPEVDQKNGTMKSIVKEVKTLEKKHKKKEEKKSKKLRGKNTLKFRKLLRDKNVMNDTKFFENNLSVEEQETVLKQIEDVKKHSDIDKPYRLSVLDADIPIHFKSIAYKKINSLKYMEPGDGEYHKIKNWVDTFMQIPFGKYKTLPLTLADGVDASHDFMTKAKCVLDGAVFGLNDAKLQVMQMIGQWIANPDAIGTAIAIKGPMGTGKTTLVKEGISKILGRDFAFVALGGATDSSFLEGHSYTYEGSTWGKIVDILVKCKCMNPIIYFDELDKLSDTPKGEEITGILTHLTDTTQNSKFHDKYFSELDFDLSRCLFIFSYNDETKVNPILRDRMYRIQTKGYDAKEKSIIANDYIVPNIREQVKFNEKDVTIPNDVINHIVEKYTDKEDGVRNLKRCLEIIHTKLNLYRLMKPGTNLFEKDMNIAITFPVTVTKEMVDKLIKQDKETGSWSHMYM